MSGKFKWKTQCQNLWVQFVAPAKLKLVHSSCLRPGIPVCSSSYSIYFSLSYWHLLDLSVKLAAPAFAAAPSIQVGFTQNNSETAFFIISASVTSEKLLRTSDFNNQVLVICKSWAKKAVGFLSVHHILCLKTSFLLDETADIVTEVKLWFHPGWVENFRWQELAFKNGRFVILFYDLQSVK